MVEASDVESLATHAINDIHVIFNPSVFSGEKFPQCDFDPSDAARALGKCSFTATFYDAAYHEVKTATTPGRYGAIVQVKTLTGQTFKRFITLYRTPGEITWRQAKTHIGFIDLPPELGLAPAALTERGKDVDDLFKDDLTAGFRHSSDAATLFAGLAEMKPAGEPPTYRNGPYTADQNWWYGLKKQTGNLRADYYLHLPASYDSDPAKKWPLILFLHGSGERGYDVKSVTNTGLPHNVEYQPAFPFILIAPQCSPGEWWSPAELNDLLDRVESKYRVDLTRVYLTGLSMGGYASWSLAMDSPARFAAVAPICGGGDPTDVARIKDIPIWVFHGGKDPVVPIQRSQEMVDALKKAGANVQFTIFPDAGHDSWTQAYAMPQLYDWLLQQHRQQKKD
jgi:predicted esterase